MTTTENSSNAAPTTSSTIAQLDGTDERDIGPVLSSAANSTVPPSRLLDAIPPIRSRIIDYVDDCAAIHYLTTCHSLHVRYHQYPVKQMSVSAFCSVTHLGGYWVRRDKVS